VGSTPPKDSLRTFAAHMASAMLPPHGNKNIIINVYSIIARCFNEINTLIYSAVSIYITHVYIFRSVAYITCTYRYRDINYSIRCTYRCCNTTLDSKTANRSIQPLICCTGLEASEHLYTLMLLTLLSLKWYNSANNEPPEYKAFCRPHDSHYGLIIASSYRWLQITAVNRLSPNFSCQNLSGQNPCGHDRFRPFSLQIPCKITNLFLVHLPRLIGLNKKKGGTPNRKPI
jgi:hypothetical protein